jgi:hypothetical protein
LRRALQFVQRADMAEVHQLIIQHGIEEARRQAATKHERMVIEAAYQVLSDDAERMGFTYSGFGHCHGNRVWQQGQRRKTVVA